MAQLYLFGREFRVRNDWCDKCYTMHWYAENRWCWDIWWPSR